MGTIRFEIRKDKIDKEGLVPIRMIYQVKGERKYISTPHKVFPENWRDDEQRVAYTKKGAIVPDELKETNSHLKALSHFKGAMMEIHVKPMNSKLTGLKSEIEKIERKLEANEKTYSARNVAEDYMAKKTPVEKKEKPSGELFEYIDQYLTKYKKSRAKGSLSVYKSLKNHLEGYQTKTRNIVSFERINHDFFLSFQDYLFDLKGDVDTPLLNNITVNKILSTLKTFINYSKKEGKTTPNYQGFTVNKENELEVIALTWDEFMKLYKMNLKHNQAQDRVRNAFCFACVTGLRYSDLKQLRRVHIKADFIDLTTIKKGHKVIIPLNKYSRAILDKYSGDDRPLPIISNQKSNEHLKKICELAEINTPTEIIRKYGSQRVSKILPKWDLIKMHCGRKTFATLSLEKEMSAQQVMEIGGWKDYKSFKRYTNFTKEHMKKAMDKAWG